MASLNKLIWKILPQSKKLPPPYTYSDGRLSRSEQRPVRKGPLCHNFSLLPLHVLFSIHYSCLAHPIKAISCNPVACGLQVSLDLFRPRKRAQTIWNHPERRPDKRVKPSCRLIWAQPPNLSQPEVYPDC